MQRIRPSTLLAGLLPAFLLTGSASAAVALLPATSAAGSSTHAQPTSAPGSAAAILATRHYGTAANASGFSVLVTTGRETTWALGGTNPGGQSLPVAMRLTGRRLVATQLPAGLSGFLSDASAPAPDDIWAASRYGGYVMHWNGTAWSLSHRWAGGEITGLTAVSSSDVWVFGTSVNGSTGTGTWHFNGRSWSKDAAGVAGDLYRASAVSRRDIWAIATASSGDFVARYNGLTWRRIPTGQVLAGVQLSDILAISPRDVWAVGNSEAKDGVVRLVLAHYNGTRWARVPTRLQAWAGRLAPGRRGGVLITATPAHADAAGLVLQASAAGWRPAIGIQSSLGCGVSDAALKPGTRTVLASGGILTRLGGNAVVWAFPSGRDLHRAEIST
jgi:hypothetical protein